jgi:IS5 family transposase
MKITTRCGPSTVEALNRALLAKADVAKVIKLDKVRADTTVVEANVAYPTDSGLLVQGRGQDGQAGEPHPHRRRGHSHRLQGPCQKHSQTQTI